MDLAAGAPATVMGTEQGAHVAAGVGQVWGTRPRGAGPRGRTGWGRTRAGAWAAASIGQVWGARRRFA
jgi:hypothetical protein